MDQHAEQLSSRVETERDFRDAIDAITSRQLSAENIDRYAEDALEDLIEVVQAIMSVYETHPTVAFSTQRTTERVAFSYFGLNPETIESTLDHVADAAEVIRTLDKVIDGITQQIDKVIVPPATTETTIGNGESAFEQKRVVPRLKTVLFILSNQYGLDISDPEQVRITSGILSTAMMRGESYKLVEIPPLSKSMLICDEIGNITYVFDNDRLQAAELFVDDLISMEKEQLDSLAANRQAPGRRIKYSNGFVDRINAVLDDIGALDYGEKLKVKNILSPVAPDHLTEFGMVKKFSVPRVAMNYAIQSLADELTPIDERKFGPADQEKIYQWLEEQGYLGLDGYVSQNMLCSTLSVNKATVLKIREKYADEIGDVKSVGKQTMFSPRQLEVIEQKILADDPLRAQRLSERFFEYVPDGFMTDRAMYTELGCHAATLNKAIEALGEAVAPYYAEIEGRVREVRSPNQHAMIREWLVENGKIGGMEDEHALSFTRLKDKFGISPKTLEMVVAHLQSELGEIKTYRLGQRKKPSSGFDLRQQQIIAEYLESIGKLRPPAPEGVSSLSGLAKEWGIDWTTLDKAVSALGDKLGSVGTYKFGAKITAGYDKAQQEMIREFLENETDVFAHEVPAGFKTARSIADEFGLAKTSVIKALEELGESIGSSHKYKFATGSHECYDPEQIKIIEAYLVKNGYFAERAPEGYLSASRMAKNLHTSHYIIDDLIDTLREKLGTIDKYRSGPYYTEVLSPAQQRIVEQALADRLGEIAPEGYVSKLGLSKLLNTDPRSIGKAVEALKEELGEVRDYRFKNVLTAAYGIEQQRLIESWIEEHRRMSARVLGSRAMRD